MSGRRIFGLINIPRIPKFVRYGLPLFILVVAGSFGLAEFTDIRVKKRDEKFRKLTAEESLQYKKKRVSPLPLEEAFQEIKENVDIETWENRRGPRPWEELADEEKTT